MKRLLYIIAATILLVGPVVPQGTAFAASGSPTTTADLWPGLGDGNYADPATVTLAASAGSGVSIANTFYTIDGGPQRVYAGPFQVAPVGNHAISYWSVDSSGSQEAQNTKSFTIENPMAWPGVTEATSPTRCPYAPPDGWQARLMAMGLNIDTETSTPWIAFSRGGAGLDSALEVDVFNNNDMTISTLSYTGSDWYQEIKGSVANKYIVGRPGFSMLADAHTSETDYDLTIGSGMSADSESSYYCYYFANNMRYAPSYVGAKPLKAYMFPSTTTSASVSGLRSDGNYADPATVSLSATVSSGHSVSNTYYAIDNGPQQTYATPFSIGGVGSHSLTYWSVDNLGSTEAPHTQTLVINPYNVLTNINLTPTLNDGTYANPMYVTLSPVADSGYSVLNTYYVLDDGTQHTYGAPFVVSGEGIHTLTYWSVDNTGVQEAPKTKVVNLVTNNTGSGYSWTGINEATSPTLCPFGPPADWKARLSAMGLDIDAQKSTSWVAYGQPNNGLAFEVDIDPNGAIGMHTEIQHTNPWVDQWIQEAVTPDGDNMSGYWFPSATDSSQDAQATWTGGYSGLAMGEHNLANGINRDDSSGICYYFANNLQYDSSYVGTKPLKAYTFASNQAPSINTLTTSTINEGDTFTEGGSFSDADSNSWTATADYGDGTGTQPLSLSGTGFTLSHKYTDDGSYTVTVAVTDSQGATAMATTVVTVKNVAAAIGQITTVPPSPVQVNTTINANANFTDPGALDSHTATWDWGDGTTSAGTVTESNGSGSVTDNHSYSTAGVYTISLTVTDSGGLSSTQLFQYLAVYNPTPTGLFSGARIFASPVGAEPGNPGATGPVHFGVTAKYDTNNNPTGKVSMNFAPGNLDFASNTISELVISNGLATLRGTGTIGGTGIYSFLVTGIDSKQPGGGVVRFQIKDLLGNVIYDSQLGASDMAIPAAQVTGQLIVH